MKQLNDFECRWWAQRWIYFCRQMVRWSEYPQKALVLAKSLGDWIDSEVARRSLSLCPDCKRGNLLIWIDIVIETCSLCLVFVCFNCFIICEKCVNIYIWTVCIVRSKIFKTFKCLWSLNKKEKMNCKH